MTSVRLEVDRELCVGSSTCVGIASGVFELGPDGKARVVNPSAVPIATVEDAVDGCPVLAITLVRSDR
jgi:ferredoxin